MGVLKRGFGVILESLNLEYLICGTNCDSISNRVEFLSGFVKVPKKNKPLILSLFKGVM